MKITISALAAAATSAAATPVFVPVDITSGTGSTATQSTPAEGVTPPGNGFAINGIDGNPGNFTHTTSLDPAPSWTVDLGRDETFNVILIHNRDNCCPERLSDITVQVFDASDSELFNSGVVNPGNALGSPAILTVEIPAAVTGRKITVSRDGASTVGAQGILSIGELQIGAITDVDLPPGTDLTHAGIAAMTTEQSSNFNATFVAALAVDGNEGNFTHTLNTDHDPTWRVDFGEEMLIEHIELLNRANCCGERLRDITVTILDAGGAEVFRSDLLNPANALGFSGTNQPGLSVDVVAAAGSAVRGQTVVVHRTFDPGGINADDMAVIQLGEVYVTGGSAGATGGFAITSISYGGSEVVLTFNSKPGATYTIYRTDNPASWIEEIDDGVSSEGTSTTYIDRFPGGATRWFYRIGEE